MACRGIMYIIFITFLALPRSPCTSTHAHLQRAWRLYLCDDIHRQVLSFASNECSYDDQPGYENMSCTDRLNWKCFILGVLLRSTAVAVNCENVKLLDSLSPAGLASLTGPVTSLTIRCVHPHSKRSQEERFLYNTYAF